jgi:hypothetical protein
VFADLDQDNSKTVDLIEFRKGLELLGLDLSVDEASVVFSHCDTGGKGEMDYLMFLDLLQGKVLEMAASLPEEVSTEQPLDNFFMDINRWLSFLDLPRDLSDLLSLFLEAIASLLQPVVLGFPRNDFRDLNLLCKYFSSWNRQREVCAVFSMDDFSRVLGAAGLSRFKFRSKLEIPLLKNWCDLNLINLQEFTSLLQKSPASAASSTDSHPLVSSIKDLIQQSEHHGIFRLSAGDDPVDSFGQLFLRYRKFLTEIGLEKEKLMQVLYNIRAPSNDSSTGNVHQKSSSSLLKQMTVEQFQILSSCFGYHLNDLDTIRSLFHHLPEIKESLLQQSSRPVIGSGSLSSLGDEIFLDDILELLCFPLNQQSQELMEKLSSIETQEIQQTTRITVSQLFVALCRVLLPSDYREALLEIEELNQLPMKKNKIRRRKRLQGVTSGDVGGKQILSENDFIVKIQSRYRSWSEGPQPPFLLPFLTSLHPSSSFLLLLRPHDSLSGKCARS